MSQIPDPASKPRLVPIPRLANGGRWRIEAMRSLREPLLLWFTQAQGRITVAGSTRGYGAHNAIFVPPGTMYGFEVIGRAFGTAVYFGRDCTTPLPSNPVHLRIREASAQVELTAILDAAQREAEGARAGCERALEHYLGLLGLWLERQVAAQPDQTQPKRPDAARRLAERYARLVEREFRSGMGIAHYAAALGVTPTHLSRVCKVACGRPAHNILQDRVLYEARQLLASTQIPVKEVARQLGFNSPAYFTRAFQSHTGMTPSAFRRGR